MYATRIINVLHLPLCLFIGDGRCALSNKCLYTLCRSCQKHIQRRINKQTINNKGIKSPSITCFSNLYKAMGEKFVVQQNMGFAREVQCSAACWNIQRSRHAAVWIAYNSSECRCDVTAISRLVTFSLYFAWRHDIFMALISLSSYDTLPAVNWPFCYV
jgi:hypothetical protein